MVGSKCAASMTTCDVVADSSVVCAAHHAGEADRAAVVGDQQVLGRQGAGHVVEGGELLALGRPAYDDRAGQLVAVVAVDRLAELEHHVVGDVDGQRDRPHAGELDPAGDVPRGGRGRVEAGDGAGHEHRAAVGRLDADRVAVVVRRRHVAVRRVVERHVVGDGRLAGDAAQRQRVGAVGVDLELDHVVAQAQQGDRVVARLHVAVDARVEDQDAAVVVAGAELAGGADHPVGHVAVGLAGGDLETAGQHRAGQRHDDQVAGREVVGAADDRRARRARARSRPGTS